MNEINFSVKLVSFQEFGNKIRFFFFGNKKILVFSSCMAQQLCYFEIELNK